MQYQYILIHQFFVIENIIKGMLKLCSMILQFMLCFEAIMYLEEDESLNYILQQYYVSWRSVINGNNSDES